MKLQTMLILGFLIFVLNAVEPQLVSVSENLGNKVSLDLAFHDEKGNRLTLGSYIDKPTIVLPVYYHCPGSCGTMLSSLSTALNNVPLIPGKDYRVLSLSFDHEENTENAATTKNNYFKLLKKGFPEDDWKFLTGDVENIKLFTNSIGYYFNRVEKHIYEHPNAIVILSKDGTVIRYLYGPSFLPFDIGMALTEASKGTPSLSIRKLISYCFSYEPEKRAYAFNLVRYIVIAILLTLGVAMFFLLRKKRK